MDVLQRLCNIECLYQMLRFRINEKVMYGYTLVLCDLHGGFWQDNS